MALHALQDVGDAVDVTREFLFPFEFGRWLKLAIVAFFVGGMASFPSAQFNAGGTSDRQPSEETVTDLPAALPDDLLLIVLAVVALVVVLGIAFAIVGAIMEFVFVESLRNGDVTVRRYWSRRWKQGLRLFGFRVLVGIPFLVLFVAWLAVLLVPLVLGGEPVVPIAVFFLGIPVMFLAAILYGLISLFTTGFVVPIMIKEDAAVLPAWGRLWSSVRAEWKQYLVFALVWFGLSIATGILASIAIGLGAVAVLIPLGVLAVVVYLTLGFSTAGLVFLGVLVAVFLLAMLVLAAFVQVPVLAYLRYYALLVLGDVEPSLDLVPDRRAAARE